MYVSKLYWMAGLLTSLSAVAAPAPVTLPKRSITLSLGYDESYNSNFGMKNLPLTAVQGYSWAFDQATKMTKGEISRTALVLGDLFIHMPFLGMGLNSSEPNWYFKEKMWATSAAYHEFGHARAKRAFCSSPFNGYKIFVDGQTEAKTINTVFDFYYYSLKHASRIRSAACFGPFDPKNNLHLLPILAGGLNNEASLSHEIANLTYRHKGHIGYFGTYLRGKTSSISYTGITKYLGNETKGNDILYIKAIYQNDYPDFDIDMIPLGALLSLLASSSTYSFLKGYIDFIISGDPTVNSLVWKNIRLPDVNFYFTRKGLSFEIITGYQLNPNLWINLGLEAVYYPFKGLEITPSLRYVVPTKFGVFEFDIGTVINVEGYVSGHLGVEWTDPANPITFQAHIIYHNANTFVGERNIPNALKGDHDIEFMISSSFNY